MCKRCETQPVYIHQNKKPLCKQCFIRYFEKKVLKTIRQYNLLQEDDVVAVGLSGGKDSTTVAHILNKILTPRGQEMIAIAIDEGIKGYRDKTLEDAKAFCKEHDIKLKVYSYKKTYKYTLDQYLKKNKINPCAACGVFRRQLLNKAARELGVTVLVTGHNLDDEAQSVLMNQLKGNMQFSAKLGPKTGVLLHDKFVKRVKPLYFMLEKEVTIYTQLKGFPVNYVECPNSRDSFRTYVANMLNELEHKYPGTKNSIINSFLDVVDKLKEQYKGKPLGTCTTCNEPSARDICTACELLP